MKFDGVLKSIQGLIYLFETFLLKKKEKDVLRLYYEWCSFADLQKPQIDLDGKACAAVGQNSLMALYDTLFSQVMSTLNLVAFPFYYLIIASRSLIYLLRSG